MAPEHLALRHRPHKKSSLSISTCFSFHNLQDFESLHSSPGSLSPAGYGTSPRRLRTRRLKSRLNRHRRHTSDLSYDAVGYAHNFEDGRSGAEKDTEEVQSFISRLPVSQRSAERRDEVNVSTEEVVHLPVKVTQQTMEV
ncbi:hypothetical protein AgCh_039475 [Apium graveolens]